VDLLDLLTAAPERPGADLCHFLADAARAVLIISGERGVVLDLQAHHAFLVGFGQGLVRGGAADLEGAGGLGDRDAVVDQVSQRGQFGGAEHAGSAHPLLAGQHPALGLTPFCGGDALRLALGAEFQLVLGGG
jgi:hypothetical protein